MYKIYGEIRYNLLKNIKINMYNLRVNIMSKRLVNLANIIDFSKTCGFCESKESVQLFLGMMLCENCRKNIKITNPHLLSARTSEKV